jgi:hypothetical protein
MAPVEIHCGLSGSSRHALARLSGEGVRQLLVGGGELKPRTGHPDQFSVSALGIDSASVIVIAAEAVNLGPKAELFRLCVWLHDESRADAVGQSLIAIAHLPKSLHAAARAGTSIQASIVQRRTDLEIEIAPGSIRATTAITEAGLLLTDSSGARLLVEHDDDVPLNLRLTCTPEAIDEAIAQAECIDLL